MARIGDAAVGGYRPIHGMVGRLEHLIYRAAGVDMRRDMAWTQYAVALLLFNSLGAVVVYVLQRVQVWLPSIRRLWPNVSADSSFNTAVSFVTNTNWQGYSAAKRR